MPTLSSAVFPPSALWDYAVVLYSREGVAPAALALQDRLGADVNMLLFCFWAAASGRRLSDAALQAAVSASRRWQEEVTAPLRRARRYLKAPDIAVEGRLAADLRRGVSDCELFAEHMQLVLLEHLGEPAGPSPAPAPAEARAVAAAYLARYFALAGLAPTAADDVDLAVISNAAFPVETGEGA